MTQYSLKAGCEKFGKKADEAIISEFTKLHSMDTFIPTMKEKMTKDQRKEALWKIMFLKHKRDNTLRGQTCADGSTQRGKYKKEEAESPTVALESVMLTAVIETYEHRDVVVVDIPSAYLYTEMDCLVHMRLTGKLVEILVAPAPKMYRPYVTYGRKNETVIYVRLRKALYGFLKSALLFHEKLVGDLKSVGFKLNPL